MAEGAVTFLLEQVKEVVKGYADLISGAEAEFEELKNELDLLKSYLKQMEMEETKNKEGPLRVIQREIRDTIYKVEDTIDTCLTNAIAIERNFFKRLFCSTSVRLATEVKSIRSQKVQPLLVKASQHAGTSGLGPLQRPSTLSQRDIAIRQDRVVGFEEEEGTIIRYLKEKTEGLDVISIVGIPGQGKTALAWKIYQNADICNHFPFRIWVSISEVFNSRDVFLQILRKFYSNQEPSGLNDIDLAQTVHLCLKKEKFLLVLDDVWSVGAWKEIEKVLPLDNGEGKVLITSRDLDVGMRSKVHRNPYQLKVLKDDESWMLLQYEVFGCLGECPDELINIGYLIAKNCDGVPLAIIVIGGILADQLTRSRWTAVHDWETVSRNVSDAFQDDKTKRIANVVALSYHRLPDSLRECFVYLGIFPEDYEIPADMLCGLWISEGFVVPRNGRSLEESAELNMNDLICMNLLRVVKTNHMGKVKTCRVHEMIRAFCISKLKDENLCQLVKRSTKGIFEPPLSELETCHRLSFRSDLSKFLDENPCAPNIRSFLCFYEQPVELEPKYENVIPGRFKKLRILESKCIKFNEFPAKLTKLVHLRYLTIYIQTLKILPESITQLWNLQSLVVETKSRSITMKANLWGMVRLRHLKTKAAAIILDNKWEGDAGQNLHTLNRLAPESCTEAVAKKAKYLKSLGISGKLSTIFQSKFLENLHLLEELKLVHSVPYELAPEDKLRHLPLVNYFPLNLKRLTLTNTFLEWRYMSTLAMIRSLEALKLKDNAFSGVIWNARDSFCTLKYLLILNADLVHWEASTESFPELRVLVVNNCKNLREIPQCVGTSLEKLEIDRLCPSAVQSSHNIAATHTGRPTSKFAVPFSLTLGPACETK